MEWESVMKKFKLTNEEMNVLADRYQTPLLTVSTEKIEENYGFLRKYLPRAKVFYAMKSNPVQPILEKMANLGASFDVASEGEIRRLSELGIAGERMIYANPVKTIRGLQAAAEFGVNKFTFDSESEIYKMAAHVPGSKVLLRVRIDNADAIVDLNTKFGVAAEDVLRLLTIAREQGLDVAGLCFHVGSQSLSTKPYESALELCRRLFDEALAAGFAMSILDIGGGLPVPTGKRHFNLKDMAVTINRQLERLFPDTEIWAEPGRYICGTAMNLIATVISTQERGGRPWYVLDDGVYGTFSGVIFDHWDYEIETYKTGSRSLSTFAGPSCDSIDIICRERAVAELAIGDRVLVPDCGAYTSASATTFNGFGLTPIVVWEEIRSSMPKLIIEAVS